MTLPVLPILPSSKDAAMIETEHVARIMRYSQATVRQLAKDGDIPAVKVGGHWRYPYMPLIIALGIAEGRTR